MSTAHLGGWGTRRGHAVRDMYLTAGVMTERGTQRGLTLGDRYLTAGSLVEIGSNNDQIPNFLQNLRIFFKSHHSKIFEIR